MNTLNSLSNKSGAKHLKIFFSHHVGRIRFPSRYCWVNRLKCIFSWLYFLGQLCNPLRQLCYTPSYIVPNLWVFERLQRTRSCLLVRFWPRVVFGFYVRSFGGDWQYGGRFVCSYGSFGSRYYFYQPNRTQYG